MWTPLDTKTFFASKVQCFSLKTPVCLSIGQFKISFFWLLTPIYNFVPKINKKCLSAVLAAFNLYLWFVLFLQAMSSFYIYEFWNKFTGLYNFIEFYATWWTVCPCFLCNLKPIFQNGPVISSNIPCWFCIVLCNEHIYLILLKLSLTKYTVLIWFLNNLKWYRYINQ